MALLHIEGFDKISDTTGAGSNTEAELYLERRYISSGFGTVKPDVWNGWQGGGCISFGDNGNADSNYIKIEVPEVATIITGFAFCMGVYKGNNAGAISVVEVAQVEHLGDGVEHLTIYVVNQRHILIRRGTTVDLAWAYNVLRPGQFGYIELKATIHGSTGVLVMQVNGQEVMNETGLDTKNSGGTFDGADAIRLSGIDGTTSTDFDGRINSLFDDWYVSDTTGAAPNNDFLGPIKIEELMPDGAGNASDFTPLSGTNFSNVDEVPTDDDTTYVSSATTTDKDTHTLEALTDIDGTIFGVQVYTVCRVEDVTTHGCTNVVRRSTSESSGANPTVSSTSYVAVSDMFEQDPAAGPGVWTVTNVNAMEAGYEVG